jgi:hypothetical protein
LAKLGTPALVFYSDAVGRVYRRQRLCIAAKLAARNKTKV